MSYIWEDYKQENYYLIQKKRQSYYQEVWKKEGNYIPVNLYCRFADLFFPEELCKDAEESRRLADRYRKDGRFQDIVNLFFHQLCYFDRLRGVTSEDLEMALVYDEICNGLYGADTKNRLQDLQFRDLYLVLKELVKLNRSGQKEYLLDEVLRLLFGKVIIYYDNAAGRTYVYIEQLRNTYRENLYQLAVYLFADMYLQAEHFWANEHFGIIGNDSTMKIGNINIYESLGAKVWEKK